MLAFLAALILAAASFVAPGDPPPPGFGDPPPPGYGDPPPPGARSYAEDPITIKGG